MRLRQMAALVAGVLTIGAAPAPHLFHASVLSIQDGDTVTVRAPGGAAQRVRLLEIDAPERAQPWGDQSRQSLADLVDGRTVRIRSEGQDRYGRTLGRLYVADRDVNKAMVQAGAAWVYEAYSTDGAFPPLEADARRLRTGLWSQPASRIVAPWTWRKTRRAVVAKADPARTLLPASTAEAVRKRGREIASAASEPRRQTPVQRLASCRPAPACSRMNSCEDARFHLRECGANRLDSDGDGVPCESLCG